MVAFGSTIAAVSSPQGVGGVAVVRMSGSASAVVLEQVFQGRRKPWEHPRQVCIGEFIASDGRVIDQILCFFLPGPRTFTGEDVVEIQCHGNPLLAQEILAELYSHGVKAAEPGEFTRRAFENDKLDLAQAEAVSDVIHAANVRALRLAQEQLGGRFSAAIVEIGEPLRDCLAQIEAHLDFPEEDIEPDAIQLVRADISGALLRIERLISSYQYGHIAREGFRVLLCGPPNAGKSSLMNVLLGVERAIVTEVSGTTRDVIEEQLCIDGFNFVLCDSAGITKTEDRVEQIGIELAKSRLTWADLLLVVIDSQEGDPQVLVELENSLKGCQVPKWLVYNKTELSGVDLPCLNVVHERTLQVSAQTGLGIENLRRKLSEQVLQTFAGHDAASGVALTNDRHRACLLESKKHLQLSLQLMSSAVTPLEIISEELRLALSSLEEIVGRTYTEDILGRIFSRFCIGK